MALLCHNLRDYIGDIQAQIEYEASAGSCNLIKS